MDKEQILASFLESVKDYYGVGETGGGWDWKQPQNTSIEKPRNFLTFDLETTRIEPGETPRVLALQWCNGGEAGYKVIQSAHHLFNVVKSNLLTRDNNGSYIIGWNNQRFDNDVIVRQIREYLIADGFTVEISDAFITVKKDKRKWVFADGMRITGFMGTLKAFTTGFAPDTMKFEREESFEDRAFDPYNPDDIEYAKQDVLSLYAAMSNFQDTLIEYFGVDMHLTIAGAAMKWVAANLYAPVKPNSCSFDLLARASLRGGYNYHTPYDGEARYFDVNKMYPSSYRKPLGVGGDYCDSFQGDGVYLVYIRNVSYELPIPVRAYNNGTLKAYHLEPGSGWYLTALVSNEIEFYSARGVEIQTVCGYCFKSYIDLSFIPDAMQRVIDDYGAKSVQAQVAKLLGNSTFGKTGLKPVQETKIYTTIEDVWNRCYKEDRVEDAFDTLTGEALDYYITTEQVQHPYMHPEIASQITARCRLTLLHAADTCHSVGMRFIYADTDSIMVAGTDTPPLNIDDSEIGAWKDEGTDWSIIVSSKMYVALKDGEVSKSANTKWIDLDEDESLIEAFRYMAKEPGNIKRYTRVQRNSNPNQPMFKEHVLERKRTK